MSLLKSFGGLIGDAVKIVSAPLETAVDLTRAVTKPIAEAVTDVKDGIKESIADKDD